MVCAEIVKAKPTGNYSGFITYSNTIYFSDTWLDKTGYLITKWDFFVKNRTFRGSKDWGEQKESSRLGKLVLNITQ